MGLTYLREQEEVVVAFVIIIYATSAPVFPQYLESLRKGDEKRRKYTTTGRISKQYERTIYAFLLVAPSSFQPSTPFLILYFYPKVYTISAIVFSKLKTGLLSAMFLAEMDLWPQRTTRKMQALKNINK